MTMFLFMLIHTTDKQIWSADRSYLPQWVQHCRYECSWFLAGVRHLCLLANVNRVGHSHPAVVDHPCSHTESGTSYKLLVSSRLRQSPARSSAQASSLWRPFLLTKSSLPNTFNNHAGTLQPTMRVNFHTNYCLWHYLLLLLL